VALALLFGSVAAASSSTAFANNVPSEKKEK